VIAPYEVHLPRPDPQFNPPRLTRNMKLVDLLTGIGKRHGVEPGVVANCPQGSGPVSGSGY
jgi:hypothetical protein